MTKKATLSVPTIPKEKYVNKVFDKKFLVDELDLPYEALSDRIVDTSRWSEHHEILFEYENVFYLTSYSCGATEIQDESPWEYDESVKCFVVEKKIVEVEKFVKIKL